MLDGTTIPWIVFEAPALRARFGLGSGKVANPCERTHWENLSFALYPLDPVVVAPTLDFEVDEPTLATPDTDDPRRNPRRPSKDPRGPQPTPEHDGPRDTLKPPTLKPP